MITGLAKTGLPMSTSETLQLLDLGRLFEFHPNAYELNRNPKDIS